MININDGAILRRSQGFAAAGAFSLLLAGTNMTTPLLPLYNSDLGFTPLLMSLTFVCYVSVLIWVLMMFSRPSVAKYAPHLICTSLVVAAMSDCLLSQANETGILLGRGVAGVAGGVGTGAAAALVVTALGAKGRSISATGNLVGAVVGTVFAQACVMVLSADAMRVTFIVHGVACVVALVVLLPILYRRREINRFYLQQVRAETTTVAKAIPRVPLAVGCVAWIAISIAIVSLPTLFSIIGLDSAKIGGVIALLSACALGQLCSPWLAKHVPWLSGVVTMAMGAGLLLVGAGIHSSAIVLLGLAALGGGAGVSYRIGLLVITKGCSPSLQSSRSSIYAAITYGAAALVILLAGFAGNIFGISYVVTALFSVLVCIKLGLSAWAPNLKDSME